MISHRMLFVLLVAFLMVGCSSEPPPERQATNDPPIDSPATEKDGESNDEPEPETDGDDEALKPYTVEGKTGDGPKPPEKPRVDEKPAKISHPTDTVHLRQIEIAKGAGVFELSPDGESLVVGYRDGSLKFHDLKTWETKRDLKGAKMAILAISQTPDGKRLVASGGDDKHGELNLWDLSTDKLPIPLPAHDIGWPIDSVAISPDGNQILSNSIDDTRLINLADGETHSIGRYSGVRNWRTMKFTSDGKYAVLVNGKGETQVVDMKTLKSKRFRAAASNSKNALAIDADGRGFILGETYGKTFRSWDFEGNARIDYAGSKVGVDTLVLAPDGKYLIAGATDYSNGGLIRIWERGTGRVVAQWNIPENRISATLISPDSKQIVTVSDRFDQFTVNVWSLAEAIKKHAYEPPPLARLTELVEGPNVSYFAGDACISSDGKILYSVEDEKVRVDSLTRLNSYNDLKPLTKLRPDGVPYHDEITEIAEYDEDEYLTQLELAADDRTLLTADRKHRIRVWDLNSRQVIKTHLVHEDTIDVLVISPDGKSFLSADVASDMVHCRDLETGKTRWQVELPAVPRRSRFDDDFEPRPIRFSSNGEFVVVAGKSSLKWFDSQSGELAKTIATDIPTPTHIAISPDGRFTAVSGKIRGSQKETMLLSLFDGEKLVWTDKNKGKELEAFAFSMNGEYLFNGVDRRNIEMRKTNDGSVVRKLRPSDTPDKQRQGVVAATKSNRMLRISENRLNAVELPLLLNEELFAVVAKLKERNVEILSVDDYVLFDFGDASATDADLAVLKTVNVPFFVRLGSDNLTGAALSHLRGQTHLIGFDVEYPLEFTDADFANLADAKNLRFLHLNNDGITDSNMEMIGGFTKLQRLDFGHVEFTPAKLRQLSKLKQLRELNIVGCKFSAEDMKPLASLTELRKLDLSYAFEGPTAEILQPLSSLTKLEDLQLYGCELSEGAIAPIAGLRSLRVLNLGDNLLTADDCKSLAELVNLRRLNLEDNPITDAGLAYLSKLTQLQSLDLNESKVVGDDLQGLAGMTDLRELVIGETPNFTGLGLDALANMPHLRSLDLASTNVGDAGLKQLAAAKHITELYLPPAMTDAGFESIGQMTGLESLVADESAAITGVGLKHLKDLRHLVDLYLNSTKITDEGLAAVSQIKSINLLSVRYTAITDDGLSHLSAMPKLRRLELGNTAITDAGLSHLMKIESLRTLGLEETKTTEQARKRLEESNETLFIRD